MSKDLWKRTKRECWKDIPDKPHYQASSHGRIRSLDRVVTRSDGSLLPLKGQIITAHLQKDDRYYMRIGPKGNNPKMLRTRLVCMAFHGMPKTECSQAHHKNENRHDDRPINLEWITQVEHMAHHSNEITVKDTDSGVVQTFVSYAECVRETRLTLYGIGKLVKESAQEYKGYSLG